MTRRELREELFKLLFRVEFNEREEMPEQIELFFAESDAPAQEQDEKQITIKYERIAERLDAIDALLNEKAEGWSTARMGKAELTILRLAVYEMLYDEEIPESVAINEAVELAKKFGREESGRFVNGILARFASAAPDRQP